MVKALLKSSGVYLSTNTVRTACDAFLTDVLATRSRQTNVLLENLRGPRRFWVGPRLTGSARLHYIRNLPTYKEAKDYKSKEFLNVLQLKEICKATQMALVFVSSSDYWLIRYFYLIPRDSSESNTVQEGSPPDRFCIVRCRSKEQAAASFGAHGKAVRPLTSAPPYFCTHWSTRNHG